MQEKIMFKPLHKNSAIGVISAAYIPNPERLQAGFQYLQGKGFRIKKGNNLGKKHGYFSGTDEERIADLHAMFADPEIDMIISTRGGWGGLRMVDRIDYELIRRNPKPLVGYSDLTTLQLAIWTKTSIPSISGPMVAVEMGKGILPFTEKHFWDQVGNNSAEYVFNYESPDVRIMNQGRTQGRLLGGCLSLVCHLLGTAYAPDFSGAVLFLEDIGEQPYKIDRYLAHLKQSGVFDQISGLILGQFIDCVAEEDERSFTVEELLQDYFSAAPYPVILNFPYGHGDLKFSMVVGAAVSLETESRQLTISNPFNNDGMI
jgi:muramoyltetrapeptide carboxypeptidase